MVFLIIAASTRSVTDLITCMFHECEVQELLFDGLRRLGGIHRSFHTEMDDLVPTCLISSLLTKNLDDTILCQPYMIASMIALAERDSTS